MDPFDELVERVKALTGLTGRAASAVAADFNEDVVPSAMDIIGRATDLGYDVAPPRLRSTKTEEQASIGAEISMDPATVLAEVYENCPRVLMGAFPTIGRAPDALQAHPELAAQIEELPEEIRALLVKVDVADQRITIWLRDEANDVDRPIGPIDLRPYTTGEELFGAIDVLLKRLHLVLRADCN